MPEIINMLQDPEIKTELFILSLDNKQGVIEKFVQMHMQSLDVKIYHISRGEEVVDMFKELKIGYRNSIPHITILNCNNERIFDGFTDTKQIENILRQN